VSARPRAAAVGLTADRRADDHVGQAAGGAESPDPARHAGELRARPGRSPRAAWSSANASAGTPWARKSSLAAETILSAISIGGVLPNSQVARAA
jgi:hypothetical protein